VQAFVGDGRHGGDQGERAQQQIHGAALNASRASS
jgi:hypothetical protein